MAKGPVHYPYDPTIYSPISMTSSSTLTPQEAMRRLAEIKRMERFAGVPIQRALIDVACNEQIALSPSLCDAMEMLSDW